MAGCEVCGNENNLSFRVVTSGDVHVFDCFECAIRKLAPACLSCGCWIIGHGIKAGDNYYCCAYCAKGAETVSETEHFSENGNSSVHAVHSGSTGGYFS